MRESSSEPRRGTVAGSRKVGRKPAFTASEVVSAAVAEGIDRFTLSAVAGRLGVATPAIYRIFPSRDDLVIACLDTAGATIAHPEPDTPWRDTLRLWAGETWQVCERFPGLSRLIYSYPTAPTRIQGVFRAYVENLAAQGKTPQQAMFALDLVGATVIASHWGVDAMRSVNEQGKTGLDTVRDVVGDADGPFQPQESWTTRQAMDSQVEVVLAGLEHLWPES